MRTWIRAVVLLTLMAVFGPLMASSASASAAPLENHGCGDTVDHSFRLANDIGPCTLNGLTITNGTADLNGHKVTGNGTNDDAMNREIGVIVSIVNAASVVVKNGTINRFEDGVVGNGPVVLDHLTVSDNVGDGVQMLATAATVKVTNSSVTANADNGVVIQGRATVTGNIIARNGQSGMLVHENGAGGTTSIKKNALTGNGYSGLSVDVFYATVEIVKNVASGNGQYGVLSYDQASVAHWLLKGNTTHANGSDGIRLAQGTGRHQKPVLDANISTGNSHNGIKLDADKAQLNANTASGNGDDGIVFESTSTAPKLFDNVGNGNGYGAANAPGYGIYAFQIDATGSGNRASGNQINDCIPSQLCD